MSCWYILFALYNTVFPAVSHLIRRPRGGHRRITLARLPRLWRGRRCLSSSASEMEGEEDEDEESSRKPCSNSRLRRRSEAALITSAVRVGRRPCSVRRDSGRLKPVRASPSSSPKRELVSVDELEEASEWSVSVGWWWRWGESVAVA